MASIPRRSRLKVQKDLFVGAGTPVVAVYVRHGTEGLHMQLLGGVRAVEATGHEVPPTVLFEETTRGHGDTGFPGHQRIGEFDRPGPGWIVALSIAIGRHAIELEDPVLETRFGRDLTRTHLVGLGIPGDDGLGSCAAGRRADAQDLAQGPRVVGIESALEVLSMAQNLRRQIDQGVDLNS